LGLKPKLVKDRALDWTDAFSPHGEEEKSDSTYNNSEEDRRRERKQPRKPRALTNFTSAL